MHTTVSKYNYLLWVALMLDTYLKSKPWLPEIGKQATINNAIRVQSTFISTINIVDVKRFAQTHLLIDCRKSNIGTAEENIRFRTPHHPINNLAGLCKYITLWCVASAEIYLGALRGFSAPFVVLAAPYVPLWLPFYCFAFIPYFILTFFFLIIRISLFYSNLMLLIVF